MIWGPASPGWTVGRRLADVVAMARKSRKKKKRTLADRLSAATGAFGERLGEVLGGGRGGDDGGTSLILSWSIWLGALAITVAAAAFGVPRLEQRVAAASSAEPVCTVLPVCMLLWAPTSLVVLFA